MGNTFGKRTLAPGFHQETARALGPIPGKTTRVQQELGPGLHGAAADTNAADTADIGSTHVLYGPAQGAAHLGLTERAFGRHEVAGACANAGGGAAKGAA